MFQRILVICTGNICRSPAAAALLSKRLENAGRDIAVRSAGTGALIGHPADTTMSQIAAEHGVSLTSHHGCQVSIALTRWAELILAMEPHHLDAIQELDPTTRGKTFLLGHWSSMTIPDPYRQPEAAYRLAFGQITQAVTDWQDRL